MPREIAIKSLGVAKSDLCLAWSSNKLVQLNYQQWVLLTTKLLVQNIIPMLLLYSIDYVQCWPASTVVRACALDYPHTYIVH